MIDFSPVDRGEKKLIDLWRDNGLTMDDLRTATHESIDFMLALIADLDDADVIFIPVDEQAYDKDAVEGEETIGWSIAHIIAHVTASSEEGAAFSSLLARGVPEVRKRPRYETPWRDFQTKAQCIQRLEESRRMRLAYLDTWPDTPHYDNLRVSPSERFQEYFGDLNAPAAFLMGLAHEVQHYAQLEQVKQQALANRQQQAGV